MEPAIETYEVTKRYRRSRYIWHRATITAVAGVSLEVPRGSIFGLVGPNGAGKTTLMRLILGLAQPSSGRVSLLGQNHGAWGSPALRSVGALIEEPRFFPWLTGRENLLQVATLLGRDATRTVAAALSDVGLADRADDDVRAYSLGMRQRLGLARCLLGRPSLLVLDEPTNGMDPQGITATRQLLQQYVAEHDATVLLSSHLLDAVEQLCDTVAFMGKGSIVRTGPLAELRGVRRTYRIELRGDLTQATRCLEGFAARSGWDLSLEAIPPGQLRVSFDADHDAAQLTQALVESGFGVAELTPVSQSLEDLYQETLGSEQHVVRWST